MHARSFAKRITSGLCFRYSKSVKASQCSAGDGLHERQTWPPHKRHHAIERKPAMTAMRTIYTIANRLLTYCQSQRTIRLPLFPSRCLRSDSALAIKQIPSLLCVYIQCGSHLRASSLTLATLSAEKTSGQPGQSRSCPHRVQPAD